MGWQTRAVSTSEASGAPGEGLVRIAKPSPLRLAGFLATAMGAAMLGIASVFTWITIHDPRDANGVTDRVYKGLDLTEGKVALIAALVLLVGLMALRGAESRTAQKVIAVVMIIAAAAGLIAAVMAMVSSFPDLTNDAQEQVQRSLGVFLAAAGGVVALLGGVLDLMWAAAPVEGAEDDG